jgi:predicted protein tyrosine phosphatase
MFILGYSEAAMLLTQPKIHIAALLAICGQVEFPVQAPHIPHQLILRFDDIDVMDESDPIKASAWRTRRNELAALGRHQNPPTIDDARRIIAFAQTTRQIDGALLCHCLGGVSRSAAAALLIMAAWTGPGSEAQCVRQLCLIRPCASPHRDLVAFGDALLNRSGQLLAAIE